MGNLASLIGSTVTFPTQGTGAFPFIGQFVYILIGAMHGGGVVGYGLAIIFFVILLKLTLLPLDIANRYFTRRNSVQLAKFAPEVADIKAQYADEPLKANRAVQAFYKQKGYKMGGFCIFTILNLTITLIIFMSVFFALRTVANFNVNEQFKNDLRPIYLKYEAEGLFNANSGDEALQKAFQDEVNKVYNNTRVGFLWVTNIWRPDTWTKKTYDWKSFRSATANVEGSVFSHQEMLKSTYTTQDEWKELTKEEQRELRSTFIADTKEQYQTIFGALNDKNSKGWNGALLLIILAGVTMYFSMVFNMKIMNPKKKDSNTGPPKEEKVGYGMRNVKNKTDGPALPQVNPKTMGMIMKIVFPIMMVVITFISTAALAIYIIANSVISTVITLALHKPVDMFVKWQDKRKTERGDKQPEADPNIINPHAKYFKKKPKGANK